MEPPGEMVPSTQNFSGQLFLPGLAPPLGSLLQVDPSLVIPTTTQQHLYPLQQQSAHSPLGIIDWKSLLFPGMPSTGPLGGQKPLQYHHDQHAGAYLGEAQTPAMPGLLSTGTDGSGEPSSRRSEKAKVTGGGRGKKVNRQRFAFQTRSTEDVLDDGYRWRKYGQKAVKNSAHPSVKKQVQRCCKDPGNVVTTYEGVHNHPCEKLMETLSPLLKQMQFLSRF